MDQPGQHFSKSIFSKAHQQEAAAKEEPSVSAHKPAAPNHQNIQPAHKPVNNYKDLKKRLHSKLLD